MSFPSPSAGKGGAIIAVACNSVVDIAVRLFVMRMRREFANKHTICLLSSHLIAIVLHGVPSRYHLLREHTHIVMVVPLSRTHTPVSVDDGRGRHSPIRYWADLAFLCSRRHKEAITIRRACSNPSVGSTAIYHVGCSLTAFLTKLSNGLR